MHEALRHRALGALSQFVSKRAWWVLLVAILLAGGAIYFTSQKLTFESNRENLISHKLPWFKRYLVWEKHFGQVSDVVIVDTYNQQGKPDIKIKHLAEQVVQKLGNSLSKDPHLGKVMWGFPSSQISPKAIRLLPQKQFKARLKEVAQSKDLLNSISPQQLLDAIASQINPRENDQDNSNSAESEKQIKSGLNSFAKLIDAFTTRLQTPSGQPVNLMKLMGGGTFAGQSWQYLPSPNGRLLLIPVVLKKEGNGVNPLHSAVGSVRQLLHTYRKQYPQISMGFTGADALAVDETASATHSSELASNLAFILIALVLMGAFQSIRKPILLMVSLLIAIAWTFGFATLAVGHLQVISVVFTVMLLSLGAAYGIYLLSRFELVRHNYPDNTIGFSRALRDSLETVGPGLFTGSICAAAAFSTTIFTNFTGVAEMGLIASVGIILCLISMVTVFPALLRVFRSGHKHVVPISQRRVYFFKQKWIMPVSRHPVITLIISAIIVLASLAAMTQMRFNYNLIALMPPKAPSVIWQRNLVNRGDQTIYDASVVADSLAQAKQMTEKFRRLDTVETVGGIGRLFPTHEKMKIELLKNVKQKLKPALSKALDKNQSKAATNQNNKLVSQVASLKLSLSFMSSLAPKSLHAELAKVGKSLTNFLTSARNLDKPTLTKRINALQYDYSRWRQQTARLISAVLDTSPITLSDFPPGLLSQFVYKTPKGTKYSLRITPNVPDGLNGPLAPSFLGHFVTSLQSVNPDVTGAIVQIYESGKLIWSSYVKAGIYALIVVFLILWLDFRAISHAFLTLLPVAIGFAVCFAIMWLLGQRINPANIIVLPLMFGIGVDVGVQVMHRYRADDATRPLGLTAGTGKGMSLTSYTTIIGFASLMIAQHRGIFSLGLVLSLGILMTLLSCWTIMPACFELISRRRERLRNS